MARTDRRSRVARWLALAAMLFAAGPMVAGTTGQLIGRVVDAEGVPLPGVTVAATAPTQLGGWQLTYSDADGRFQYPSLAPGYFTVRFSLDGYVEQEAPEVQVRVDRTAEVRAILPAAEFASSIEATTSAPVVDPTQVSIGQTFSDDYIAETSAMVGNWTVLVTQAAGTDPENFRRIMGSVPEGNTFLFDGADATNKWGRGANWAASLDLPVDVLQEVVLHSAGFEAEYGLATGGVVNAVTKSGGNRFAGTVDLRYRDNDLEERGEHYDPDQQLSETQRGSTTLGGPILRDRLWFFGAYGLGRYLWTPTGAPTSGDGTTDLAFGKLSWQASPAWSTYAALSYSPQTWEGVDSSPFVAAGATTDYEDRVSVGSLDLTGVLGEDLLWSLRYGRQRLKEIGSPSNGDRTTISHRNLDTGQQYGNAWGSTYNVDLDEEISTEAGWFLDGEHGSHDLRAGARLGRSTYTDNQCMTQPGPCLPGSEGFRFLDGVDGGGGFVPLVMVVVPVEGEREFSSKSTSFFLQDAWRARANMTLKLGLRWDRVRYGNARGTVMDLEKLQSRAGITWDLTGDGLNLVRASWGRFMSPATMAIAFYTRPGVQAELWSSCSFLAGIFDLPALADSSGCAQIANDFGLGYRSDPEAWDPAGWMLFPEDVADSQPVQVADGLRPMFVDQWVVGFERQIFDRTSLELSYVRKRGKDLIEDTCSGNFPVPSADANCSAYVIANLPGLRSEYDAWMLRFESRALERVHLLGSWVVSDSKGSVDYGSSGTRDYDIYPHTWYNRYGYRSDQSRHRVKLSGYVLLPWDVTVAINGWWNSEFRWTPVGRAAEETGISSAYPVFVEPRGNRAGGSYGNLDVQLGKGFDIGPTRVRLLLSAFNLLDTEAPIGVCDRTAGCGGNLELGDPVEWRQPRRYEVGVRVEF